MSADAELKDLIADARLLLGPAVDAIPREIRDLLAEWASTFLMTMDIAEDGCVEGDTDEERRSNLNDCLSQVLLAAVGSPILQDDLVTVTHAQVATLRCALENLKARLARGEAERPAMAGSVTETVQ